MSKQTINIGASPNDGTGTPLRTSFDYTNQNFTELYTALGGGVGLPGATTQVIFNDGGTNLAGDAGLVYNKTTDALTVAGLVTAGSATITGAATVGTTLGVTGKSTLTGNVAVGTTSSPWLTGLSAVDISSNGLCAYGGGITHNAYYDNTDSRWEYKGTGAATFYNPQNGVHQWFVAASGTANNPITTFATAAMELTASGNLAFPTGKGIDFSATASGSGTMTSELLNDYEEGTFLPNVQGGTTTGVGVYSTTDGRYTKIGRLVTAEIYIVWTAHTGTGDLRIGGLPFTANASFYSAATIGLVNNIALSASNTISAINQINATYINIIQSPVGGGAFSNVPMDVAGAMILSITYSV